MYIIGLNSKEHFYFISTEEQRQTLESKGILVLEESYDRLTAASAAVKELNQRDAYLWNKRLLKTIGA